MNPCLNGLVPLVRQLPSITRCTIQDSNLCYHNVIVFTISYGEQIRASEDRYGIRRLRRDYSYPYDLHEAETITYIVVAREPNECDTDNLELFASAIYCGNVPDGYTDLQLYDDAWCGTTFTALMHSHLLAFVHAIKRIISHS